jgi:hypothetical protein
MNIISFENAYSLYPRATFEERRSLVCASAGPNQDAALLKYEARGWDTSHELSIQDQHDPQSSLRVGYRWIDDDASWIFPLDTTQLAIPSDYPSDPASLTNWKLVCNDEDAGIEVDTVTSQLLEHCYALTDPRVLAVVNKRLETSMMVNDLCVIPGIPTLIQKFMTLYSFDQEFRVECKKAAFFTAYQRSSEISSVPRAPGVSQMIHYYDNR